MDGTDLAHRRDHRDGRLAAAGHHIDVRRVEIGVHVDRRYGEGADRGRGQVDNLDAVGAQRLVVDLVRIGRGRVERDADLAIAGEFLQPLDPFMGRRDAMLASHREAFGGGVDPDHRGELHILGIFDHLHHQVGADIARADDRRLHARHGLSFTQIERRNGRACARRRRGSFRKCRPSPRGRAGRGCPTI